MVAIDHRGHGRGIRSRRRFHLSDCADDAAALVAELGLDRVIAVGYSMGGPIAQLLWRRHREVVGGLVLCATSRTFASRAAVAHNTSPAPRCGWRFHVSSATGPPME